MTRSIGYARCSTTHQDTAAQTDELKGAGCVEVFAEKVSSRAPLQNEPMVFVGLSVQKVEMPLPTLLGDSIDIRVVPLTSLQVHAVHHP